MVVAVRYFSRSGNTESIGIRIGEAVHADALPVSDPLDGHVDLLFLGGALYAFHLARPLRDFIRALSPQNVGAVAVFSTAANPKGAYAHIARACEDAGLHVLREEYHCLGKQAKTPEAAAAAARFAKQVEEKMQ